MKKIILLMLLITAIIGTSCKVQASGSDVTVTGNYNGSSLSVTGRLTTDEFDDYFYSNGDKSKPFKLVNFNDAVGTQYKFNVGNSQVVRTIVAKSTSDDMYVPALNLYIKVSRVKEDVPTGLTVNNKLTKTKTIYWSVNHKFGVVYAEVVQTDGTLLEFPLTSTNAGAK